MTHEQACKKCEFDSVAMCTQHFPFHHTRSKTQQVRSRAASDKCHMHSKMAAPQTGCSKLGRYVHSGRGRKHLTCVTRTPNSMHNGWQPRQCEQARAQHVLQASSVGRHVRAATMFLALPIWSFLHGLCGHRLPLCFKTCNFDSSHSLHGLHGFHGLHGLLGLHGLHGARPSMTWLDVVLQER